LVGIALSWARLWQCNGTSAFQRTFAKTDNRAETIKTATTSAADYGSISEESTLQAGLATRLDKSLLFKKHPKQRIFMKPFIPTITILVPLFFFAACGPSNNPEANSSSAASPAAAAATITASPNPVTLGEGPGTTTITWNTGDGTMGQVYVSEEGAPEAIFAEGSTGSAPAPWIVAGKTFKFRLYAGTEHAKALAEIQVTGRK
jgi:hypothetical protein